MVRKQCLSLFILFVCFYSYCLAANANANIYLHANAGMFSQNIRGALPRAYVPNTDDNTVSVIDTSSYQVVDTIKTDKDPEHIVPSYDLKTIWILNAIGNTVTPIDPVTSKRGASIPVQHPYNLYFTPDGHFAITVDDIHKQLAFRDPQTMSLHDVVLVNCDGLNHMDFTRDNRYAIATCEYSSKLVKIDLTTHHIVNYLSLSGMQADKHAMPQDIRSSPDGHIFYVADMFMDGVFLIDPVAFKQIGFIPTGKGTHSIYPSRDGKLLYISNRGCNLTANCPKRGPGSITVLNPVTQKIVATWPIIGGGSPDMGNINGDGKELWLSGKYDEEVYVINTTTGQLIRRIPVGRFPHGLTVWPQPGRYSLGHTGIMR